MANDAAKKHQHRIDERNRAEVLQIAAAIWPTIWLEYVKRPDGNPEIAMNYCADQSIALQREIVRKVGAITK